MKWTSPTFQSRVLAIRADLASLALLEIERRNSSCGCGGACPDCQARTSIKVADERRRYELLKRAHIARVLELAGAESSRADALTLANAGCCGAQVLPGPLCVADDNACEICRDRATQAADAEERARRLEYQAHAYAVQHGLTCQTEGCWEAPGPGGICQRHREQEKHSLCDGHCGECIGGCPAHD